MENFNANLNPWVKYDIISNLKDKKNTLALLR